MKLLNKLKSPYYFVTRYIEKICRSLAYAKQGWNSFDWDYAYAVRDMIFKFTRMAKTIKKNNIIVDNQKVHDDIMEFVECLKVLIEEGPERAYWDEYYEKYGYPESVFTPVDDGKYSTFKLEYPKVKTEEDEKEREKMYWDLMKREEKDNADNMDKICDIIKNKLQTFWD